MDTHTTYFTADGKEITVRPAIADDALDLLELKKSYIKATRSLPLYEYEYKNGIREEKELIERYIREENSLLLVAVHGNVLIGNLDITGSQRKKLYHTGMLGMGVAYTWHNKKAGSFLMESALAWAQRSLLTVVWLEVYATNLPGIRLYEKFGFEHCGLIKNFFNEEELVDKITMVKYV